MNAQELNEVLKSNANKLAKDAIELIQSSGPVEELVKMVANGCGHTYIERDPAHPRTRFLTHYVLDTCFDTHFGVQKESSTEGVFTAVLGEVHQSEGREPYFKLLLEAGFSPGRNGYRGDLFQGILFECFYPDQMTSPARRETAKRFARILIDSGRFDLQQYATNNYHWVGGMDKLETILAFGANPEGHGMIDNALGYIACAASSGETDQSRVDVIQRLLELGATPQKRITANDKRYRIESYGLLEKLAAFGVIDLDQPSSYMEYLLRRGLVNPRRHLAAV